MRVMSKRVTMIRAEIKILGHKDKSERSALPVRPTAPSHNHFVQLIEVYRRQRNKTEHHVSIALTHDISREAIKESSKYCGET